MAGMGLCLAACSPEKENKDVASEFSGLVKGTWANPEMNCLNGFGLCEVRFFHDGKEGSFMLDSMELTSPKPMVSALLVIYPEDTKTMRIEFQETCLNWDDFFVVDTMSLAFTNVIEDFTVVPIAGVYPTNRKDGAFGSVSIGIELVEN